MSEATRKLRSSEASRGLMHGRAKAVTGRAKRCEAARERECLKRRGSCEAAKCREGLCTGGRKQSRDARSGAKQRGSANV